MFDFFFFSFSPFLSPGNTKKLFGGFFVSGMNRVYIIRGETGGFLAIFLLSSWLLGKQAKTDCTCSEAGRHHLFPS
jgi:hypothetical protein